MPQYVDGAVGVEVAGVDGVGVVDGLVAGLLAVGVEDGVGAFGAAGVDLLFELLAALELVGVDGVAPVFVWLVGLGLLLEFEVAIFGKLIRASAAPVRRTVPKTANTTILYCRIIFDTACICS